MAIRVGSARRDIRKFIFIWERRVLWKIIGWPLKEGESGLAVDKSQNGGHVVLILNGPDH